jgi:hypothetical protein
MESPPFLKTRYRAIAGQQDEGDHWLGGAPTDRSATCPVCKIPLLLLWDINCRDRRFPCGKFGPLTRLPLYFCWGCVSDLSYRVNDDGGIAFVRVESEREGPSFPYKPYPAFFERRPLALNDAVPEKVRSVLSAWAQTQDHFGDAIPSDDKEVLSEFFGHPIGTALTLLHSQFGGIPTKHSSEVKSSQCPNEQCGSQTFRILVGRRGRAMSFLAEILNDPLGGLPMVEPPHAVSNKWWNFLVSVRFEVCGKCWTIRACNRSD